MMGTINTRAIGREGERAAAEYLESVGFTVITMNFFSHRGEIDIIGIHHGDIVFAEIKTLPEKDVESLEYLIDKRKIKRIVSSAKDFLFKYPEYEIYPIRFDVLVYDTSAGIHTHLENAFFEEGIG